MKAARACAATLAVTSVAFHLWLVFSGLVPNLLSRPLHLALALPWVFFLGADEGRGRLSLWAGRVLCVLAIAGSAYVAVMREALDEQYGSLEGPLQYVLAVVLIVAVLEMARRAVKAALPTVATIALAYGLFGQYVPGEFGHAGIPLASLLGTLVIAEGGLWGQLTGVSVNIVAVFVILGAFVGAGEGGIGFMALATRVAGRLNAGAAKVSVLSSALFGSISGSASANVASTGAITLPAMRRLGYPPAFAAAVEAVASSGGQIMPPLMGAGAFVMVELLRTQYTVIMAAALLPALLFFFAVWVGVDRFARRYGLAAMAAEDLPDTALLVRTTPFFVLPFGLLLGVLFATGYTPQFTDRDLRFSVRESAGRALAGCISAAQQMALIASVIICAGIIIGVLNMTGLGVKITSVILGASGGNLWLALLLTALACLVLGMEVPTTAAYIISISVAGPALEKLGLAPLLAHLFVFWYALLSTITPPVCGTVFIAAGMARTPWLPVAGHAMRLGLGLYLVPLGMVANPALIAPMENPVGALLAAAKVALGLALVSSAVIPAAGRRPGLRTVFGLTAGATALFAFGIG